MTVRVATLAADGISGPKTQAAIKTFQGICGLTADGVWGQNTEAAYQTIAVQLWQRRNGFAADGIVGPKSWAKLIG